MKNLMALVLCAAVAPLANAALLTAGCPPLAGLWTCERQKTPAYIYKISQQSRDGVENYQFVASGFGTRDTTHNFVADSAWHDQEGTDIKRSRARCESGAALSIDIEFTAQNSSGATVNGTSVTRFEISAEDEFHQTTTTILPDQANTSNALCHRIPGSQP